MSSPDTAEDTAPARRTYGNWRRSTGFGVGRLSTGQTGAVFAGIVLPLILFNVHPLAGAVAFLVCVLLLAVVLVPVGGYSVWTVTTRALRFSRARRKSTVEYTGGVLTEHPRRHDLPGPMAPLVPLTVDDGRGGQQALLWDRRTGYLTAILRCSPVGLDLADQDQADQWVAAWGAWLADLGYQPMLRWASVTVDTAPTGGGSLRDYVAGRESPHAPATARQIMGELVTSTPQTTAEVNTWVAITFDPSRATPRPTTRMQATAEVLRWLPGLEQSLGGCGVAVLGRATVPWLLARLRAAYDPAARGDLTASDARHTLTEWSDAAPVRAHESWDSWRHDSGISVAWGQRLAPRQAVTERVLTPLLAPGPYSRRVTWLYTPYSADVAAEQVERQITNLSMRHEWARRTKRDLTQRDRDDARRAQQAASEESQGAGVGDYVLYVTSTVTDDGHVPAAIADVELRAGQAKLRLRRLRGAMAAGFAGALGMGCNLAALERRHGRR